uniref:Cyclin G associated kinase n=1 Tax=Ovis aries TaxID=9940 RepID=A0AC11D3I2_SHEEP
MSLLQSALDFLAGPGSLGGAAARDQTDFVGQTVEMGELRLRVRRVLAEGGFAFVYEAQDLGSGREYALKGLSPSAGPWGGPPPAVLPSAAGCPVTPLCVCLTGLARSPCLVGRSFLPCSLLSE